LRWSGNAAGVCFQGAMGPRVTEKDLILHLIGTIGAAGGSGYAVE
jgi:3-isopropylmalate/(R)-2-methylmalate dehydratase large subunit